MSSTAAGYECLCGFKTTRATSFLRHIKEAAAPGEVHRLIEADAERLAQADNQIWQTSPDRNIEEQQSRAEVPRKGSGRASRPGVSNDKEGPSPATGTNSHHPSSGGEAQTKARRKRSDSITHSEGGATTKRQATADILAPVSDLNLTSQAAHGPYPDPDRAQATKHAALYTGAYNTRSRSQQRPRTPEGLSLQDLAAAPMYPLNNADQEVEHTVQHRTHTSVHHEAHARSVHVLKSSADGGHNGTEHCAQEPDASELPVSVTACFDDPMQSALTARQGKDNLKVSKSGNPLFIPYGNEDMDDEQFLPHCWDADGLAEWFVYLISWENRKNSLQGLLGGLYILAFAHELWKRVTWPPVSVITLLALFAVGHSAMPAGMPALSKMLRKAGVTDQSGTVVRSSQAFQELTMAEKKSEKGVTAVWGDCKDVVADISCTALQAISDVAQMWEPPPPMQRRPTGSARGNSSQALLTGSSSGRFEGVTAEAPVGLSLNEVVKAGLILLQRASCYRSTAHTVAKLCLLWVLLFLSESAVLSQWNCAMAAYVSCFGWRSCWERYGDLLEELLRAVGGVLPLLCSHHYRGSITIAAGGVIVVMWMLGAISLVPRITVSVLAGLVCLLWQLQRRHHQVKQHQA